MKKFLSIIMAICMIASLATLAISATDAASKPLYMTEAPEWIITEIGCDQAGDGTGGWSDSLDPFEYYELYNNSGKTLNLYDYGMFYNGVARTAANFETVVYEYTPFLPGLWFDGWTGAAEEWTYEEHAFCGVDNVPKNPDTCEVAPGECVVIWSIFRSAMYATWNDGKGMQIEDFRNFYNIPADVKVICWDGNNATGGAGGHVKNFTPKNSAVCTYGVCLKSDILDADANKGTTTQPEDIYEGLWSENAELISWATVDFTSQVTSGPVANMAVNFTLDPGIGAEEFFYEYDARRMMLTGSLTTLQKLTLGVAIDAGEKLYVGDNGFYAPYLVDGGDFLGVKINGTLFNSGETVTLEAGEATFEYAYGTEETTPADTTTAEPSSDVTTPEEIATTGPADDVTTPVDTTTATPTTTPTPDTEPTANGGGCGGFVALGMMACIIPAAVVVCKKKH